MLFARDLWRGKLRLWITYWICGVGGNMSLVALPVLVYAAEGAPAEAFLWLLYACSLAWFVLIFVARLLVCAVLEDKRAASWPRGAIGSA